MESVIAMIDLIKNDFFDPMKKESLRIYRITGYSFIRLYSS